MAICPECRVGYGDDVASCPEHGCQLVPDDLFLPPVEPMLAAGTMVGEYRIEKKLGAGTFGEVYAGEQPLIGKRVAVKVLNRRFASDPAMVSRFVAEARAVNKIRQRNIIDIFSFGVLPDRELHYFVMELLEGRTLGELMDEMGRLPVSVMLPIVRGIADGLDAAHNAGVTHRDLKPDNVFLVTERDGTRFPKLLDFGIAKLIGDNVSHKTSSGMVLGTPRYMSPEQARGKPADHRADIYALGVMIHEMLTGTPPFVGESAVDLLLKHAVDPPPSMSSVRPDLPRELDAPVLAMLEKRPADRPDRAGEAVSALAAVAQKLGIDRASAGSGAPGGDAPLVSIPRRGRKDLVTGSESTMTGSGPILVGEPTRREGPRHDETTMTLPPPLGSASAQPARSAPPSSISTLPSELADPEGGSQAPATIETTSGVQRRSRRWKLAAASAGVVAVVFSGWALGHTPVRPQVASEPREAPEAGAPQVTPAPSAAEPTAQPAVALADVVELRLSTRPADVEVWLGDRKLGTSSGPVMVARGSERVELRLRKTGFKDETVALRPDRAQALEASLSPLAGRPAASSTSTAAPATSARRMERILGDRE